MAALVGQFEFTEWTPDNHLRHSRFVALRADKKQQKFGANKTDASRPLMGSGINGTENRVKVTRHMQNSMRP